jgi:NAD(P) transhydrogenase
MVTANSDICQDFTGGIIRTFILSLNSCGCPSICLFGRRKFLIQEELTRNKTPYESSLASYSELAKGQMLGDDQGLLKILFDPDSLKLLGVHIIGDRAAEIVHIGQAVLTMGATVEYFRDTVFNYPKPSAVPA